MSRSLGNASGRSLAGLVRAHWLDAAPRPGGRGTFGRQAGEDGGRRAAAPQQAAQGYAHPGFERVPVGGRGRSSGGRGGSSGVRPLAVPFEGLQPPLGRRDAVQGHADGGGAGRAAVGEEGEGGRGGGEVRAAGVDGQVGDGRGEAAQLRGRRATGS